MKCTQYQYCTRCRLVPDFHFLIICKSFSNCRVQRIHGWLFHFSPFPSIFVHFLCTFLLGLGLAKGKPNWYLVIHPRIRNRTNVLTWVSCFIDSSWIAKRVYYYACFTISMRNNQCLTKYYIEYVWLKSRTTSDFSLLYVVNVSFWNVFEEISSGVAF